jgi:hypothetical protein
VIASFCRDVLQMDIVASAIVPDELQDIQNQIHKWIKEAEIPPDIIFTSGGTGFAPRDITPEVKLQSSINRDPNYIGCQTPFEKGGAAYMDTYSIGNIEKDALCSPISWRLRDN